MSESGGVRRWGRQATTGRSGATFARATTIALLAATFAAYLALPAQAEGAVVGASGVLASGPPPTSETQPVVFYSDSTATLRGTVNPNGSEVTECDFEYGTGTSYESSIPCEDEASGKPKTIGSGTSPVAVVALLQNLSGATGYHYRVVASNGGGTSAGNDLTFRTQATPVPTVESVGVAGGYSATTATLGGEVDPNGSNVTSCVMEWGKSSSYEASLPCEKPPGAGNEPVEVTASLKELTPGATYHFRFVATNGVGTGYGNDHGVRMENVPVIKAISPKKGPAEGGTIVTISSTSFMSNVWAVTFASLPASFEYDFATNKITAISPPGTAGYADIQFYDGEAVGAMAKKDRFKYGLTATGISPASGPAAGGTQMTITGAGFAPDSTGTRVEFGKAFAVSVTCSSTTECAATVPAGKAGRTPVTVIVDGAKAKAPTRYVYTP
jgi:hypothetical protein